MAFNTDLADPEVVGNYMEGVFWIVIGIILGLAGRKANPVYWKVSLMACGLFIAFGVSDWVEAQTGAWWRPLWLLGWKGFCLLALAFCYWKYRGIGKASASQAKQATRTGVETRP